MAGRYICKHKVGDTLRSEETQEVYELTAIGKRYALVEIKSSVGGLHEFPRRISEVNKYKRV